MSAGARTTHPRWCRPSSCQVGLTPYAVHKSNVVELPAEAGERDRFIVYVAGDVDRPTVHLESFTGPIPSRGLLIGRLTFSIRQARVVGHLLSRVARRAS